MSLNNRRLVRALDSLVSELKNYTKTTSDWTPNQSVSDSDGNNTAETHGSGSSFLPLDTSVGSGDGIGIITRTSNLITHTVKRTTTETFNIVNDTVKEVTLNKQEVTESDDIGIAEKVVIGAVLIVVFLAILAIILRLCQPRCTSKSGDSEDNKSKLHVNEANDAIRGYSNIGVEISSQSLNVSKQSQDWSQSTGSNPSTDWSEIDSDKTKSTSNSQGDSSEQEMSKHYRDRNVKFMTSGEVRRSATTTSLPAYLQQDRLSSRSFPIPPRKINEELISVISTQSLEPLRMEQAYRDRWDDQWDPQGTLPRTNLSHHSHPSESQLSLNSQDSSTGSIVNFPVPSRDVVQRLHMEKDKRYPSNSGVPPIVKKDKHKRPSQTSQR